MNDSNPLDCEHANDGSGVCQKCGYKLVDLIKAELTYHAFRKALEDHEDRNIHVVSFPSEVEESISRHNQPK